MTSFYTYFIWAIVELLRGNYKQLEYCKAVLPFTVLRRLDCVLALTKEAVLASMEQLPKNIDDTMRETTLNQASDQAFHNTSPFTFEKLLDDPEHIAANLNNFINGLSHDARESVSPKYLFLFTKTQAFHKFLQVKAISSTIENVSSGKYANVLSAFFPYTYRCPSPPLLIEKRRKSISPSKDVKRRLDRLKSTEPTSSMPR